MWQGIAISGRNSTKVVQETAVPRAFKKGHRKLGGRQKGTRTKFTPISKQPLSRLSTASAIAAPVRMAWWDF
jgi:hypothetical protein